MNLLKIFLLVSVLSFQIVSAYAKTYLVAVGVSDYPGTDKDLRLPANDAATIRNIYSKNSNVESVLLQNSAATKNVVLSKLQATFSKAKTNDIIVFFFSGHGSKGAFCAYDAQITYKEIRHVLSLSKARNKMIFADACFSGKMREGRNNTEEQTFNNYNIMLFLSSRGNETSIERRDMKNGFFTSCLQKGLRGGADTNKDRTITAKELFNYVSKGVRKLSNDKQHPVMWGKFSDSMAILKW